MKVVAEDVTGWEMRNRLSPEPNRWSGERCDLTQQGAIPVGACVVKGKMNLGELKCV